MNKRIQELMSQAVSFRLDPDSNAHEALIHPEDLELFAELIVRECEKVAKDGSWYYDAPSCGWRAPINHVCNVMKQHFGVEE